VAAAKAYNSDEVPMMTKDAFNALLKTIEEPPPHAFFILATTELHKVPETIQSRCQRFPFRRIGDEDIVRYLQKIADQERINADRDALRAIARHVNGGMRDAISLLDQLSSLEKITVDDVRSRIGESGEEYVERVWNAVDAGDRSELLSITASLQQEGISLEIFLRQLLGSARDQLHAAIESKEDTAPVLIRLDAIFQALRDLRNSPLPIIVLESALVDLCGDGGEGRKSRASEKETKKSAVKEARTKLEEKAKEGEKTEEKSSETPQKDEDAEFEARELTLETLRESWPSLVKNVGSASLRMSLKDASIDSLEKDVLHLRFTSTTHRDRVLQTSNVALLESEVEKVFRQRIRIEGSIGEAEEKSESVPDAGDGEVNVAEAVSEIFG
jgi:DNA polymerase III gamma/tau subunit